MVETIVFLIGIIQIGISIVCYFFKKKWQMQFCVFSFNILLFIQFILKKHYTEAALVIVDLVKIFIFLIFDIKKLKPNLAIVIFFEIAMVVCCILTWKNWYSLFLLFANMLLTFGYWQTNVIVIRIITVISSLSLIGNYVFTKIYTNIIAEILTIVSVIVTSIIYRKDLLKAKNKETETGKEIQEKEKEIGEAISEAEQEMI